MEMRNHCRALGCPVRSELSPADPKVGGCAPAQRGHLPLLPSSPGEGVCCFSLSVASPSSQRTLQAQKSRRVAWVLPFLMLPIPKAPDCLLAVGDVALAPRCEPGQRWWQKIFLACSPLCGRHCARAPRSMQKGLFTPQGPLQEKRWTPGGEQGTAEAGGPGFGGRGASPGWPGRAPGTSMGMGTGRGQAGPPAHGWVWLGGAHGRAGQRCGDLESGPCRGTAGTGTDSPGGLTWRPGPARAFPTAFCCGWRPLPSLLEKTCSSASCPGVSALRCCAPPVTMPVSGRGGVTALL